MEKKVREYWKILGPGLTTGAADDDPSGIATYSEMGASRGFGLLWLSIFTFPLMGIVQEMCARIGLATGAGLASNIKRHFGRKILYFCAFLLLFANVFNIGADLGAMAKSAQLIFPEVGFVFWVFGFAGLSVLLQIFVPYKEYSKYLKYLALALFAYIFSAFFVITDWGSVIQNLVLPSLRFAKEEIFLICAAVGTTISPYLFFWQTAQEVEEEILKGEKTEKERRTLASREDIKKMRIDVWSGMFFSNLVMFFIIAGSAATLFKTGITEIETVADAAEALRPVAGDFSFALFAIAILGTGLLAMPVLASSAAYAISETFNWKEGLYRKWKQASAFYGVIVVALALGIMLNFVGLDPVKGLIYSAALNGIIAPVIFLLILRISASQKAMGDFKNKKTSNIFGWLVFCLLAAVSVFTLFSFGWK